MVFFLIILLIVITVCGVLGKCLWEGWLVLMLAILMSRDHLVLVLKVLLGDCVAIVSIDSSMGRVILAQNRTFTLRFSLFALSNWVLKKLWLLQLLGLKVVGGKKPLRCLIDNVAFTYSLGLSYGLWCTAELHICRLIYHHLLAIDKNVVKLLHSVDIIQIWICSLENRWLIEQKLRARINWILIHRDWLVGCVNSVILMAR